MSKGNASKADAMNRKESERASRTGGTACPQLGDESPLVDRPGAARYLKMCTRSVDNYARGGVLPYLKLGSRVLFRKVDLDALIEANIRRAGGEQSAVAGTDAAEATEAP